MISGVELLDLQHEDCRFPVAERLFCGELRRDDGSSYCERHHRIAYPLAGGGRAFTAGGFLADSVETVAPPRAARAHEFAPPRTSAPDPALLDQFVRAAAARRHRAPPCPSAPAPARRPQTRIVVAKGYVAPLSSEQAHAARESMYLADLARQCERIVTEVDMRSARGINYAIDMRDRIASMFDMTIDELLANRRTKGLVKARQLAMFCVAVGAHKLSLPFIGRRIFRGFDHTTVLHARNKIPAMIADGTLPAQVAAVLDQICAFDSVIADAVRKARAPRVVAMERQSA